MAKVPDRIYKINTFDKVEPIIFKVHPSKYMFTAAIVDLRKAFIDLYNSIDNNDINPDNIDEYKFWYEKSFIAFTDIYNNLKRNERLSIPRLIESIKTIYRLMIEYCKNEEYLNIFTYFIIGLNETGLYTPTEMRKLARFTTELIRGKVND